MVEPLDRHALNNHADWTVIPGEDVPMVEARIEGPAETPTGESPARWRALAELLWPDRARWLGLAALVAANSLLLLAGPLVVRRIVDNAADGTTAAAVLRLGVGYLLIALGAQALAVGVAWYATVAAWRTTNGLRMQMAEHVLGLDHEFHRTHTPGELIQRVDGDVTSVSDFLGKVVPKAAGALLLVVGMVVVLLFLDWRIALGMAVYLALSVAVVVRSRHRAVTESSDEMGSLARLYGGIEERLTAAEDLRANGAATHTAWRFVEDSTDALASGVRRERAFLTMWWFVQMVLSGGWVLALVLGAVLVSNGAITVGTAFLLFQYVQLVSRPLEDVVHQLETVQKANGAMVRVIDLLAVRADIVDDGQARAEPGALAVDFDGVDFDYHVNADSTEGTAGHLTANDAEHMAGRNDGNAEHSAGAGAKLGQPVLRGIDLHIAAGHSVGVIGRTGSGKTTLSRLVLRLVESTAGQVRLGGVPIQDLPIAELRRRVALVPQEVELFGGTIRDNVTLFDAVPTDAEVAAALVAVGLTELAADIHRALGAGGAGVSAGEAQLLALARVWLRDPDLVVLDEATARVDPATEQRIEQAIAQLISTRTAIVIAHRLSTLHAVDDIVVVDAGTIVEHGRRVDLLDDDSSRFRRLLALALEDMS
jgi:ATP-binding cassette subfamily B protein